MSEADAGLKWSSDKPKVAGWYWWRETINGHIINRIVEIYLYPKTSLYVAGHGALIRLKGEWAGLIEPPEEG